MSPPPTRARILIVDDDANLLERLARQFRRETDFIVQTAPSLNRARQLVLRDPHGFDAVVVDLLYLKPQGRVGDRLADGIDFIILCREAGFTGAAFLMSIAADLHGTKYELYRERYGIHRIIDKLQPEDGTPLWKRVVLDMLELSGGKPADLPAASNPAPALLSNMGATSMTYHGLFLSHTSADKPFVRRLAGDLRASGVRVWLDEAEIQIGDSLIAKISEGLKLSRYVGVVLSPRSITAPWVEKELDLAMNREIAGRQVVVLPLLYEQCEPPEFLKGKLYADFTNPATYAETFARLLRRLEVA